MIEQQDRIAALEAEVARLREALAAEDAFRIAYQNFRDAPLSNRKSEFAVYAEAAKRCDTARAALEPSLTKGTGDER